MNRSMCIEKCKTNMVSCEKQVLVRILPNLRIIFNTWQYLFIISENGLILCVFPEHLKKFKVTECGILEQNNAEETFEGKGLKVNKPARHLTRLLSEKARRKLDNGAF